MRIRHRITTDLGDEECAAFAQGGVNLKEHQSSPYVETANFDAYEDDPGWEGVERAVARFEALDIASTEFTARELSESEHLGLVYATTTGYPDDFKERSYDLSQYCRTCGIGLVQTAPIQLSGEPKCKKGIFQVYWLEDEYFAKPDVWEAVFKPMGIGCREVWNRRQQKLQTVVQLDIKESAPLDLDASVPAEDCADCGRKRYLAGPMYRGRLPAPLATPAAMFKSTQWTGGHGNHASYKVVLLTQELYKALVAAKVDKGLIFAACGEK